MPTTTVVIQVEGILRKPVTGLTLDSGKRLYHSLASMYNIVLVTEETNREHMSGLLAMEGFDKHAHVIYGDFLGEVYGEEAFQPWWLVVALQLTNRFGYNIEYFVLSEPYGAKLLIDGGYSTIVVTNAEYALPDWLPGNSLKPRPWDDYEEAIDRQRRARQSDDRMKNDPLKMLCLQKLHSILLTRCRLYSGQFTTKPGTRKRSSKWMHFCPTTTSGACREFP